MKNFKYLVITTVIAIISNNLFAQTNNANAIPQPATTFMNSNYPGAKIKKWKTNNDQFVAKAIVDGQKSDIIFDKDGTWLKTVAPIKWESKLPNTVNKGYHKSGYFAWRISSILKVKNNAGDYYEIIVNNGNLMVDATNQFPLPTYKQLEFKPDGKLINVVDITNSPVSYSATTVSNQ